MIEIFMFSGLTGAMKGPLRKRDILVRNKNIIDGISPLATVGEYSERFLQQNLSKYGDRSVPNIISLKKNFGNMISRNASIFDSNFRINPYGENVDVQNNTDYIVISFLELYRPLYKIDGGVYSSLNDKEFSDTICSNERIPFPFPNDFDWRYYIDLIAKACLENYDSSNIILLRAQPSEWCFENNELRLTNNSYRDLRNFIREAENCFIDKTHCHCIEEMLGHASRKGMFNRNAYSFDCVAEDIYRITNGSNAKLDFYKWLSPMAKRLQLRLAYDKYKKIEHLIKKYDCCTEIEFERCLFVEEGELINNLKKLKIFLEENAYTLTDYYRDNKSELDLDVIELYVEYFKLNMDDFLTVIKLFISCEEKESMRRCIEKICDNEDCYPIKSMKNFMQRNIEYISKYKYIDNELSSAANISLDLGLMAYPVRLSDDVYLILRPAVDKPEDMIIREEWKEKLPDIDAFIKDGMYCRVNELNMLSRSWKFYIQRAKLNKGSMPVICKFKDASEFQRSMVFINYEEVLESENAILTQNIKMDNFRGKFFTKCDLTPLIKDDIKIFNIGSGLGDQIRQYIYSKYIESFSGASILYDDLMGEYQQIFNGLDIKYFVKDDDFDKKRLSNIVSKNLKETYIARNESLADLLFSEGWEDCLAVIERWIYDSKSIQAMKKCDCLLTRDNIKSMRLASSECFKYYLVLSSPENYLRGEDLNNYLSLPQFTDEYNKEVEKIMLSCDAVVLHIRCGDALYENGRIPDESFFFNCLNKLSGIKEYDKKKYFIISDNMKYVKSRIKELGLSLVDDKDIYYLEHNRGKNSIFDLKLISLGKIIITSYSGFSRMAALFSTRKEIYLCQTARINEAFKRMGWKNKYELLDS